MSWLPIESQAGPGYQLQLQHFLTHDHCNLTINPGGIQQPKLRQPTSTQKGGRNRGIFLTNDLQPIST